MVIHAYDESYINTAQNILGHAVDFAVMSLNLDPDTFGNAFAVSSVSKQFASGNPRYVAGMNGCELVRIVLAESRTHFIDTDDAMYLDKSPEYWAGWALAYYQWYTSRSFIDILSAVPLSKIINMYTVYHEMDVAQFVDHMDALIKEAVPATKLRTLRINCGMSQSELSKDSGVALRQIQLFEQRQRDINNASAITLLRLSRSLHCRMEELMEY
ncbi:MAG: helix-turn-helix domain-containing protein [Eubacterium sp.]|nr:helix-turn-helix domain-containing protein [Eubacterium sp.]